MNSAIENGQQISASDLSAVLRMVATGGSPDVATVRLPFSPATRSAVASIAAAARWGALVMALVFAIPNGIASGEMTSVVSVSAVMMLTVWRTFRPLRLGSEATIDQFAIGADVLFIAAALSFAPLETNPFVIPMLVIVAVVTFGWGLWTGAGALASIVAVAELAKSVFDTSPGITPAGQLVVVAGSALVAVAYLVRYLLIGSERRKADVAKRIEQLSETNDLLALLHRAARQLPGSLDQAQAEEAVKKQITEAIGPKTIVVLQPAAATAGWETVVSMGTEPVNVPRLPDIAERAIETEKTVLANGPAGFWADDEQVFAVPLSARGEIVGVLVASTDIPEKWGDRDLRVLSGLQDVLGLSLDNVRRFATLRSVGADQERERIARDLHDRLGQAIAYVAMEIDRIGGGLGSQDLSLVSEDLSMLHEQVSNTLEEFRETLRQLRTSVDNDRGFVDLAKEHLTRMEQRCGVSWTVNDQSSGNRLKTGVEQEMLRLLQEAANNIEKYARADSVTVTWRAGQHDDFELVIVDDGVGFDMSAPLRTDAFGIRGMAERAEQVEAFLDVDSTPGVGTTIRVARVEVAA